ncbi:mCG116127, isoform CRA_a, partial [Mus musculus]
AAGCSGSAVPRRPYGQERYRATSSAPAALTPGGVTNPAPARWWTRGFASLRLLPPLGRLRSTRPLLASSREAPKRSLQRHLRYLGLYWSESQ